MLIWISLQCFLVAYSQSPQDNKLESTKIYLREHTEVSKFKHLDREVQKHSYDVIFEVNKYQLFLTDESNRQAAYIQNYERLTVELSENYVEVTLSGGSSSLLLPPGAPAEPWRVAVA